MGNATIWWEPRGAETVRKVDLGAPLADLQELPPDRQEVSTETYGGIISTVRTRSRPRIRVVSSPWLSYDLWEEVQDMADRMRQGGRISLAEDSATAWAAYASDWTNPDVMVMESSPWAAYGGTVATSQRIRSMGPSPRLLTEGNVISGGSLQFNSTSFRAGGVIVPTRSRKHDWSAEDWILVRHYQFWPCLRLPADMRGQGAIMHKHRRSFSFEMVLEVDMAGLAAIADTPSTLLNGQTDEGNPTMTALILANGGA